MRALPLIGALAAAGALAGCGGSSAKSTATPTTTAPAGSASRAAFTQCLESHGVPASVATSTFGFGRRAGGLPPSTVAGAAVTRPTLPAAYSSAFTTCRQYLPRGNGAGFLNSPRAAAYRQCLQLHLQGTGVTLPSSPTTTPGGPPPTGGASGIRGLTSNPTFQQAEHACASLRPAGTTPPTSTGA